MGVPCGLLIYIPGGWEADPVALAELRRYLSDEHGVTLDVLPAAGPMLAPTSIRVGLLARQPEEPDLRTRIAQAFFSLDWLDLEDVS